MASNSVSGLPARARPCRRAPGLLPKARARRQLERAASSGIEQLEGRVMLSITTPVDHSAGFAGATDLTLNGGTSITGPADAAAPNALQITTAGGNEARSAFTTQNVGVDTFDTNFTYIYDPAAPPNADGLTFTLQAGAPTAVGYLGYAIGYAGIDAAHPGIQNSIAVKFDLWKGGPTASETGLYANGVGIDGNDAPETTLTTTPAPIGTTVDLTKNPDTSATGIDFHANPNDVYQVHLSYSGGTTLSETLTDQTMGITVTQTFDLGGKTVAQIIGSHAAHAGFTGGTGGANAIQDITKWTYTGTEANVSQLNPPVLTAQTTLGGEIVLNYTSPGGQTGYEIDRSSDNGATFQSIATVGANVNQYAVTGLDPTKSYQFKVRALGDNTTTLTSAFSNTVTQSAAGTPPTLTGHTSLPGEVDLFFGTPFTDLGGFEVDQSSDGGATFQPIATLSSGATNYMVTGLDPTRTYEFEVKTLGNGTTTQATPPSAPLTVSAAGLPSPTTINDSTGFTSSPGLVVNGSATLTGATGTPPNALQLTNGQNNEAGSAFFTSPQLVDSFDTTFDFTFGANVTANADGLAFVLQNTGPTAVGQLGFGLGFQGIAHGFGVFFNLYPASSQTGLLLPGGRSQVNDLTLQGFEFHSGQADIYQAHLVYDGGTLTETLTDTTSGLMSNPIVYNNVPIAQLVGSHAALAGFTGGTGGQNSEQDVLDFKYTGRAGGTLAAPVANAISCAPGVIDVGFAELSTSPSGYDVYESSDSGATFSKVATLPATASYYEATGLNPATTYQFKIKALGNGTTSTDSAFSNVVTTTQAATAPQPLDFSNGFTTDNTTGLQLNGSATLTGPTPTNPSPANALSITPATNTQIGSAFTTTPQLIGNFDTQFDFSYPVQTNPPADGLTFILQSESPTAIGPATGGGLGYGPEAVGAASGTGIQPSVAIKFDLYSNFGEGTNSTGLFARGDGPTVPDGSVPEETSIDMTSSGVVLGLPGDTYRVHLTYDGTTLHQTVTDVTKNTTFSHDYTINLARYIEAGCAYVGFAGATGGLNAEQDILNWKFTGSAGAASQTVTGTAGNDTITIKVDSTDHSKDDVWINAPTTGAFTTQVSNGSTIVVNSGGGTDTLVFDSSNGNPLPTGTNAVLRLNGGTGTFAIGGTLPTIDATHVVDVGTSTVNIPYTGTSILPAVQTDLKNGFIKSSDAAGSSGKFAVADIDTGSQITLKYLVVGDLTADGTVNFNDLLALAQHYNQSGVDWSKGDLNYDGSVNFNDLLALAQHYNQSSAAVATAAAASSSSLDLLAASRKTKASVRK